MSLSDNTIRRLMQGEYVFDPLAIPLSSGNVKILAWQWTPGWGNLFTITIASLTLIASVAISWITLGRNADQFTQNRIDALNDKLRVAIVDLNTAVAERQARVEVIADRVANLWDTASELATRKDLNEAIGLARIRLTTVVHEELSDTHGRIQAHAQAISLMTTDPSAADAADRIVLASQQEYEEYVLHISHLPEVVDNKIAFPADFQAQEKARGRRLDSLGHEIDVALLELRKFAKQRLRPASD